jgi:NADPH:quinone reductase-like Zn-dependent oxidoreductase
MKTSFRTGYGDPAVLEVREAPVPQPGPGETLVQVHAATVSRTDCGVLQGRPYVLRFVVGWPRPRRAATGTDFTGEVVAVGAGAARFQVGERVMGFDDVGIGSHAEYLLLEPRQAAVRVPSGVSSEHAAASMEGAHYARNALNKVPLAPGDEVLVYGGTGAIGSAAVALLHEAGAVVTAVCARRHHAAVRGLGADRTLDHEAPDWLNDMPDDSFAFVFDAVGKLTRSDFLRVLRHDGFYISSELGPWGQNLFFAAAGPLMRGPRVRFPFPTDIRASLDLVTGLLADGRYTPLIDRNYGLDEIAQAFTYADSGQKVGSILLTLVPEGR